MPGRRQAAVAARLTRLDVVGSRTGAAAWVRQVAVAIATILLVIVVRTILDEVAPGVGPFTPTYPILLLATLIGRGRAGLLAWAGSFAYIAVFALPPYGSPSLGGDALALTIISFFSMLLVVLLTEGARIQATALLAEREVRLLERDMLLEEVDHRLKNNLAMLSGLLAMQIRETESDEAREVLARVATRLQSLGKVYENLRHEPGSVTVINAAVLVEQLCSSLSDALGIDGRVTITCDTVPVLVTRDRASALALLLNEVVTNAAKHAFGPRDDGRVHLRLARESDGGAVLEISDDGAGMDSNGGPGGRGRKLLDALSEMAGGDLQVDSGSSGTRYRLHLRRLP